MKNNYFYILCRYLLSAINWRIVVELGIELRKAEKIDWRVVGVFIFSSVRFL
jgi:hypothetical protein